MSTSTLTARVVGWDSPAESIEVLHLHIVDRHGHLVREEWEVRCEGSLCSDFTVTGLASEAAAMSTVADHVCLLLGDTNDLREIRGEPAIDGNAIPARWQPCTSCSQPSLLDRPLCGPCEVAP